ncbi:MAG: DUF4175 family protein [Acidobacteriota bacterium]|nr:hypothetical protein [Blastocatellia bacterium]MDW8241126.1 DUF4175 family protein [Acidobacteriota bacterium]
MNERAQLTALIEAARRRWRMAVALKGLLISVVIAGIVFICAASLVQYLHGATPWLVTLRAISLAGVLAALGFFLLRPLLRNISDGQMARFIEERNPGLYDRLVSAVDFAAEAAHADALMVQRLIRDAAQRAQTIALDTVVPRARLRRYAGALAATIVGFGVLLSYGPHWLRHGFSTLYLPWLESVQASPYAIIVHPGDARVPQGIDQPIIAKLSGFDAERVELYFKQPSQPDWTSELMQLTRESQDYRFVLMNLQETVRYYVQAGRIRSPQFTIEVADLARVERISLSYQFPAYTAMPTKTVEDGGDIVALKGTRVTIQAILNRPADAATIVLDGGATVAMQMIEPNRYAGQITVSDNSTYRIDLSAAGERYAGSGVYEIIALDDAPPTVRIEKPGRDMKATSIQEVFTQARAEDDYGVASMELRFSVNGGKEQTIPLYRAGHGAPKQLTGTHTFFLEEFNLQPGDVITYYATAKDGRPTADGHQGSSDIYFLEIRPFDRTFRQVQQNPNAGGGDGDQNTLAQRQKEIIAATWRLIREQPTQSPSEWQENLNAVTLIQERLRQDTHSLATRIRQRFGASLDEQAEFKQLADYLTQATHEMDAALKELRARQPKDALPAEQRALQQLMRADAIFRDIQVAFGSDAGGQGAPTQAEDLADLFELELDKMKNQYETLQRERRQQQDRQLDETLRKLQQLARRQQQQAEQQMRRSLSGGARNQTGGSAGGEQQQLAEETRELARQLERLSRERRDQRLSEISQQLQRAADQMQQAQQAGNSTESAAHSQRAAEQLDAVQRRLRAAQQADGQQSLRQLQEQAARAAQRQKEIAKEVDHLARSGQTDASSEAIKQRLKQRKQALADEVTSMQQEIEAVARAAGQNRAAAEALKNAAEAIERNQLPDKIRQSNRLLENGWYDQARQREKEIQDTLNQIASDLQRADASAGSRPQTEKLEEALQRTRRLADDLESLQQRLQQQAQGQRQQLAQGQSSLNQQNQQDRRSAQQGRLPGQQNQSQQGRPSAQQNQNQQGRPSSPSINDPSTSFQNQRDDLFPFQGGRPRLGGDRRQWERELDERIADIEALRRQLGSEFAGDLAQLIQRLRQLDAERLFNDPDEIARLKSQLIDPLRALELELARRLQAALGQRGPMLMDEASVPEGYRKLVEEYYKRLAKSK